MPTEIGSIVRITENKKEYWGYEDKYINSNSQKYNISQLYSMCIGVKGTIVDVYDEKDKEYEILLDRDELLKKGIPKDENIIAILRDSLWHVDEFKLLGN